MKLLLIEDDKDLSEIISMYLQREHYLIEQAATLHEAYSKAFIYEYDCLLLDIMLPDGNGLDLLRKFASRNLHPNVIILSAKDSVDDKIEGLELGADDYLAKPFHLAELLARIKSIVRRKIRNGENIIRMGNLSLNPDSFHVEINGAPLELGRKEFDILHYFINRPNRVIEKQQLAEGVWGDYIDQVENYDFIYTQMKNLRKRLKDSCANIEIKTIYGIGYKLSEE